ncbi:PEGA domain-containing protein [Sorangium sp. So ce1151]|uniref:PEGA domain-containing protein n=1 Tax=Sorangium sp. So ce1151 TaxID=3133332 RepID=UPI003F5F744F
MHMNRWFVVLACLLIPLVQARSAFADKAAELFTEGSKAAEERNWGTCRAKLLEAWATREHWRIAANLGACELNLGMYRDAAEHISRGLRVLPADVGADTRAELTALLGEASTKIVTLTIKTDPPDAEVLLDGRSLGRGPFEHPIPIEARTYAIEIRAAGREPFKGTIEGRAGQREAVDRRLDPLQAPAPPAVQTPAPVAPPPPTVPIGRVAPDAQGPSIVPVAIGCATAAVALGVSVGLSIAAGDMADDARVAAQRLGPSACGARRSPAACEALEDARRASDSLTSGAVASFLAGGALMLGTIGFAVLDRRHAGGGPAVRAAPTAGMSGGGVTVAGSW